MQELPIFLAFYIVKELKGSSKGHVASKVSKKKEESIIFVRNTSCLNRCITVMHGFYYL